MCGINGVISSSIERERREAAVRRMNQASAHRGPDHDGIHSDGDVTFGHRRLSIIDLSPQGNQPFFSSDKRYFITYNGELYNYRDLKLELQRSPHGTGHRPYFFQTNSDTEVILAAFIRYGKECLHHFRGMFAFAIYDTVEKKVFAARDRMGVKPFYYSYNEESFIFSSEVRSILRSGLRNFSLNKEKIAEYLMFQTVYAPQSIVKEIKMLLPGHCIEICDGKAETTQYYDLSKKIKSSEGMSYEACCGKARELLTHSVQLRMVSDVPFGAFLSGGIDSSAVVALMSAVSSEKVRTFNISFDESDFSESQYAKIIAKKFNTEHHEIRLKPDDFLKQIPQALASMDHPGGDGPNTYVVSGETKKAGITMALSGIGGDELFCGYDVFKRMAQLRSKAWLNAVPSVLRKAAGTVLRMKKEMAAHKKADILTEKEISFATAYPFSRALFSKKDLEKLCGRNEAFGGIMEIVRAVPQAEDHFLTAVSLCEMNSYLPNVLLRDTDQMSMAHALEVREPFLDPLLTEFVLGVKDDYKFPFTPKKFLTDSLGDLLPVETVKRKKMGFTLPWQHWMKNELKDFCEKHMVSFANRGFCHKESVMELWQRFLAGDPLITWSRVWHMVVLDHWIEQNLPDMD